MEKQLITWDGATVLADEKDIHDVAYFSGDENVYIYNNGEMEPIGETYTSEDDCYRYFIPTTEKGWLNEEEREIANRVEVDGVEYYEITGLVDFDDEVLDIQHGINTDRIMIGSHNYDVDVERIDVDIELVETIPQDYPHQEFTRIYRGKDEDGNDIEVRETHPFFEDDAYPTCEVRKFD